MRCTSCNENTKVLETRRRPDGSIRRRRECRSCGRRFTTGETPEHSDWLGELPEVTHGPDGGGPLEGVRRRVILAEKRAENERAHIDAVTKLVRVYEDLLEIASAVAAREAEEEKVR
jgi:hypothetical protein